MQFLSHTKPHFRGSVTTYVEWLPYWTVQIKTFLSLQGFPGSSEVKASAWNAGDRGSIPVGKILWRRKWQLTPVLLPGKSHGGSSVVGYTPWGHRVGHD